MSQNTIVVVSKNPADYLFAEAVSKTLGVRFAQASSRDQLHDVLCANLGSFILWDYDSVLARRPADAKLNQELLQYFAKHQTWPRVFAISSSPLRDTIAPGNFHLFSKYLLRNFNPRTTSVYAHVIRNVLVPDPFKHHVDGVEDVQVQKTKVTNSGRKKATLEALGILLEKKSIPKRVASSIIRATDELILNAIFDAPVDGAGRHYKHAIERGDLFELTGAEEVEIELISSRHFLEISVTDSFGSLVKEDFIPLLAKNFQTQEVQGGESGRDRGLGLYQILNSGLSMQVVIEPGKRTRMSLVAPWVDNVRELRDSFRFFCLRTKKSD